MADLSGMLTTTEYGEKVHRNKVTVAALAAAGELPGAVKIGRDWLIPEDTPWPNKQGRPKGTFKKRLTD